MKNYNIYFIIPVCIIILLFACSGKQDDGSLIKFEKEVYDFGKVNEGDIVSYTYIFKNNSQEDIIISDVRPSCGCTVAGEYDREVKPGESGKIPINLKTDGFQGDVTKTIRVLTNVPGKEEIFLSLQGEVLTPIVVTPKMLWLGQVKKNELSLTGFFTVTNNTDTPLKLLDVSAPNDKTIVKMTPKKEGKEYQIDISINPPFRQGRVDEILTVKTNIPGRDTLSLRYSYSVQEEVFIYPQNFTIEPGPLSEVLEKIVRVENYDTAPIAVINPQFIGKTIDFSIEEQKPGMDYLIKLLFPIGFELKEKEIFIFSFQVKKNNKITVYNIPIHPDKSSQ